MVKRINQHMAIEAYNFRPHFQISPQTLGRCNAVYVLTLVSMLILGAVSLANLMNCLGSRVLTTISPDFCTARKAAAVEES